MGADVDHIEAWFKDGLSEADLPRGAPAGKKGEIKRFDGNGAWGRATLAIIGDPRRASIAAGESSSEQQ